MSILATVENGVVKLPADAGLPDGTTVRVEAVVTTRPEVPSSGKTFAERYAKYIGCVKDGPEDLAANHDHYLYGTPKREEHPVKEAKG